MKSEVDGRALAFKEKRLFHLMNVLFDGSRESN